MKILVLGADGQLGQCVKDQQKHTNFSFIYASKKDLDISNEVNVLSYFKNLKPDIVLNLAAYTDVDGAESNHNQANMINGHALSFISDACYDIKATLIHISTDYVFDGFSEKPYKETDKVNPQSIYGKSKLIGEYAIQNSNCHYFIIRSSWIFSEYGSNFMKTIINLSQTRDSINVIDNQVGCPTYAQDLAKAIISVILRINKNKISSGIYHYCGDSCCSWYDFSKIIVKEILSNIKITPISYEEYGSEAERPQYSSLNCDKFHNEFNSSPSNWKKGIETAVGKLIND